ncbi:alpha/beta fold hydrolase [Rhizosaccharibacter radicis]|uniref:Alpha/beta hydrolase n=1 Tax=Rhizosaccharibacter radicis TaxID=2782605 RepID=A0ABT1VWH4_9PROT|nr:alpha/beta hydrolase [Acetobacteraceae bacterium KSS12]
MSQLPTTDPRLLLQPAPASMPLPAEAVDANRRFFPGFSQRFVQANGVTINVLTGGSGPALLLLHGHPETHVAWHRVAAAFAQHFSVVMTDLRGYGDSEKPPGGDDHVGYSKREMGRDQIEVMRALGHDRFGAIGHDRGARVLHQMMLDAPAAVERGVMLDILPADMMYARTDQRFATRYFWWFFHIQKAPLPEQMITACIEPYLREHLAVQNKTPGAVTDAAFAEYLRGYRRPGAVHAVCEDYRASMSCDIEITRSGPERVSQPLLALWGAKGTVGQLFDVPALWRQRAADFSGQALPCGHLIPEEAPDALLAATMPFLRG